MDRQTVAYGQIYVHKGTGVHYAVQSTGPRGVKLRSSDTSAKDWLVRWPLFMAYFEPVADWYRRQAAERGGAA